MLSGLHSLRSASNEMPSPFSASSGSVHQILGALFKAPPFGCTQRCPLVATLIVLEPRRWFFPPFGWWRRWWLLLGFQSAGCWRFAPQCCAWRSVRWRRRVRRLISQPSRQQRRSSGKVRWRFRVCRQRAVPTRDAQPFNREDKQRRVAVARFCQRTAAVVCLSSQTLGITVGRHAFGPPQPSLGFE
jgi:hypothetical protein